MMRTLLGIATFGMTVFAMILPAAADPAGAGDSASVVTSSKDNAASSPAADDPNNLEQFYRTPPGPLERIKIFFTEISHSALAILKNWWELGWPGRLPLIFVVAGILYKCFKK